MSEFVFFLSILALPFAARCSTNGCSTKYSSTWTDETISCYGYLIICKRFEVLEDIKSALDSVYGKWYIPNMWKHYCAYRFSCDYNQKSIAVITELFDTAFGLKENIPLNTLASLPSYDIALTKCSSSHMPLVFNAYKYFEGAKDFTFSFIDCNINDFNLIDFVTMDTTNKPPLSYIRAPRLKLLNLTSNIISTISSNINSSIRPKCGLRLVVNIVDLSYNKITEEGQLLALCCTADLFELYLRHNRIEKLSPLITPCLASTLKLLDLADNEIDTLSNFALFDFTNLEYLDLSGNKLSTISRIMFPDNVKKINLQGNNLHPLDTNTVNWLIPRTDIYWPKDTTLHVTVTESNPTFPITDVVVSIPPNYSTQINTLISIIIPAASVFIFIIVLISFVFYAKCKKNCKVTRDNTRNTHTLQSDAANSHDQHQNSFQVPTLRALTNDQYTRPSQLLFGVQNDVIRVHQKVNFGFAPDDSNVMEDVRQITDGDKHKHKTTKASKNEPLRTTYDGIEVVITTSSSSSSSLSSPSGSLYLD